MHSCQPEKQPGSPRHSPQEPATTDIRVQANGDLWHRYPGTFGGDSVGATSHQPQASSHNETVTPDNNWLAVTINHVIQFVFFGEKADPIINPAFIDYGFVKKYYVATGTKRFVTFTFQPDRSNIVIVLPALQLWLQQSDHFQRQRIERSGLI